MARQYEELKRTQGLVDHARRSPGWEWPAALWRHTIDKHAQTITEQVYLLYKDLTEKNTYR